MNEIDERHRRDIWKLVQHLKRMRFHLTCLAQGTHQGANAGVYHWARVHEIYMDITVYAFRYHRSLQLPPVTIDRDPGYVESLQTCIVHHMNPQEGILFQQMLALVALMRDERRFHQPKKSSHATGIVTALFCEKLDDLLTYMDIGVLARMRTTKTLQLRCPADSDAGRLLRTRLSQGEIRGELFLWDKSSGTWRYTGMSSGGDLLIFIEELPDGITQLPHWSELRPQGSPEVSTHTRFATGNEHYPRAQEGL